MSNENIQQAFQIVSDYGLAITISVIVIYFAGKYVNILLEHKQLALKRTYDSSNPFLLTDYVANKVWMASRLKLDFIKSTLLINHIQGREEKTWLKILNFCTRETNTYLSEFNLIASPYGNLGDLYEEKFRMDYFSKELRARFDEFCSSDAMTTTDETYRFLKSYECVEDIQNIMLDFQNDARALFLKELKSLEDNRKK